jgi:hypothetical protein
MLLVDIAGIMEELPWLFREVMDAKKRNQPMFFINSLKIELRIGWIAVQ